jgi:hypothetical protein
MPTEEKKTVDIDTSGPGAEIDVPEEKDETVVETESKETKQESETTEQEETKKTETSKKSDEDLEEYSKGVQSRIAKLTRKMREAERREQAAVQYARAVDQKRLELESRFKKSDSDYVKKFESSVQSGLESAQRELASAIEDGDAKSQIEANKKLHLLRLKMQDLNK